MTARRCLPAILTLLAAAASAYPAAAESTAAPTAPAPKAVVAAPEWDAGKVIKGDTLRHSFEVKNEGNAPLEILEVAPSCGCTVADYDKVIAPGATGKINVTVDTATFDGPTAKAIIVLTNDAANPRIRLQVAAETRPHIRARPGYARYIYVLGEVEGTIHQTVFAADGMADFQVTKVESPYPYLEVSFREATPEERDPKGEGRQWRVSSTLLGNAPVGPLTDYIRVHTNHPNQRVVTIPVSGFVRPVFAITPPEGDIGTRTLAEPYRTSFVVQNFATEAIQLGKPESTVPGITAELQPVTEGRRYNLVVTVSPTVAKGPLAGSIRIPTESPKKPMIEVQLKGTIE